METGDKLASLAGGHTTHSMEQFNLTQYVEKDRTEKKQRAELWARGDFKALVRKNMEGKNGE